MLETLMSSMTHHQKSLFHWARTQHVQYIVIPALRLCIKPPAVIMPPPPLLLCTPPAIMHSPCYYALPLLLCIPPCYYALPPAIMHSPCYYALPPAIMHSPLLLCTPPWYKADHMNLNITYRKFFKAVIFIILLIFRIPAFFLIFFVFVLSLSLLCCSMISCVTVDENSCSSVPDEAICNG